MTITDRSGWAIREPIEPGWSLAAIHPASSDLMGGAQYVYRNELRGLQVLSAIDIADDPANPGAPPRAYWHVSVMARGVLFGMLSIATDEQLERVRSAFDMGGAEEDNHGPGKARHLWLACGSTRQPDCACKTDEDRHADGARVRFEEA